MLGNLLDRCPSLGHISFVNRTGNFVQNRNARISISSLSCRVVCGDDFRLLTIISYWRLPALFVLPEKVSGVPFQPLVFFIHPISPASAEAKWDFG
jgi:hypothetical protein